MALSRISNPFLSNDSLTTIKSSSANTITANTGGATRWTTNNTGLGIGITPSYRLHVDDTGSSNAAVIQSNDGGTSLSTAHTLRLRNANDGNSRKAALSLQVQNASGTPQITQLVSESVSSGYVPSIILAATVNGGISERAKWDNNGVYYHMGATGTSFNPKFQLGGFSLGSFGYPGGSVFDTGIQINQGSAGGSMLFFCSTNYSDGQSTVSAVYHLKFYYDGNNAPAVTHLVGNNNYTFGTTGTNPNKTVTVTGAAGNAQYAWLGNK